MEKEMILLMDESNRQALGTVRCLPGLYAAVSDKGIWVKGWGHTEEIAIEIKQLPVKKKFLKDDSNRLYPPGLPVPVDVLPALNWQPLQEFVPVKVPVAALPGNIETGIPIKIVASAKERKGEALVTTLSLLKAFAETAPEARLEAIVFAVSENKEVLLMGNPLPPMPGREYWLLHDILLPCGYDFDLPALAVLISEKLIKNKEAFLLFDDRGTWQKIDKSFFVKAARSAVRLTLE
ncbi:hypothetical protein [Foetidibacter luteolus]|uniref:hypothetical protein n=1 Tax=Foetidibacter luteolus TaxID=2608880 RepID=UPI00129AD2BA|nr:hypothetical protein [Foetidibacter luteolus]